ncbi:uncharacterized protein LAJ45_06808 [Morchella importuna]|uniref:uncharacterized protein n=1 Tax=Morchella importuna TaxID=1174673 RepID=UPI001E8E8E0C|nr:uncharacterized protein LAJ45_06808 [Morchella importuna]KAH8149268.1 hypothetical protein LAJ45_06808 [Morchella importuna]
MPPLSLARSATRLLRSLTHNQPRPIPNRRPFSVASIRSQTLLQHLQERELVESVTGTSGDLENLIESNPITTYAGVDPTANSLHVGHLLPLMNLLHFYLNGHHSIALVGKATASVGDPSGRTTERDSVESQRLQKAFDSIWRQIDGFFESAKKHALLRGYSEEKLGKRELVTNGEWLEGLGFVEFLSTVGRHVRVSQMLARESVKGRMTTGQGINFAEFTYQLLQSYDFWHLHNKKNCRLQIGGNDQFGNITAGIDLITKLRVPTTPETPSTTPNKFDPAYGLTVPLLTTPSGAKFGKTAGNAVWLDPTLTSPFELYQFFVRLPDDVIGKYLKMFTLLPLSTVSSVLEEHLTSPEKRRAQHLLASEVVMLIHGGEEAKRAELQTKLLFPAPGETMKVSAREILQLPGVVEVPRSEVVGELVTKVARRIGVCKSKGEADNVVRGGGLYVGLGSEKVMDTKAKVEEEWLVDGEVLLVRFGKGKFCVVKVI